MLRMSFIVFFISLCTLQAHADRLVNENYLTSDSDDAEQQRYLLGYKSELKKLGGTAGVWLGHWRFRENIGSEDYDVLRVSYERELSKQTQLFAELNKLRNDDWSPVIGSLYVAHQANDKWRWEGSFESGLIDSVAGLRQRLKHNTWSGSVDWRFAPQWTVVGALLTMSIDDGNDRNGGVLRLIYEVPTVSGLNLQTRSKIIKSDFDGNGYFSPPELQEHLLLVGYSRAVLQDNWVVSGLFGGGTQRIKPESGDRFNNDLYYAELKLRGWFNDHIGMEGRAYCTNTGGPNFGTPDDGYRYCNTLLSILGVF